jgi:hypothetical protein
MLLVALAAVKGIQQSRRAYMNTKKTAKIIAIATAAYMGLVVLFESSLGFFQPEPGGTIIITTVDEQGQSHDRVVSRFESGDELFIAANHWPRAWFQRVRQNPELIALIDGESANYQAVLLEGAEHDRLALEYDPGLVFRFLTGFPPRYFLRLERLSTEL